MPAPTHRPTEHGGRKCGSSLAAHMRTEFPHGQAPIWPMRRSAPSAQPAHRCQCCFLSFSLDLDVSHCCRRQAMANRDHNTKTHTVATRTVSVRWDCKGGRQGTCMRELSNYASNGMCCFKNATPPMVEAPANRCPLHFMGRPSVMSRLSCDISRSVISSVISSATCACLLACVLHDVVGVQQEPPVVSRLSHNTSRSVISSAEWHSQLTSSSWMAVCWGYNDFESVMCERARQRGWCAWRLTNSPRGRWPCVVALGQCQEVTLELLDVVSWQAVDRRLEHLLKAPRSARAQGRRSIDGPVHQGTFRRGRRRVEGLVFVDCGARRVDLVFEGRGHVTVFP